MGPGMEEVAVYWFLLILCGLMGGAGLTLALRPPFGGAVWVAALLGLLGLLGAVFSFRRLFREPAEEVPQGDQPAFSPGRFGTGPVLTTEQGAGLVLLLLERTLGLLRVAGDGESLDAIARFVEGIEEASAELGVAEGRDRLTSQVSRRFLELARRFGEVQRTVFTKAGREPDESSGRITLQETRLSQEDFGAKLADCSRQVSRLAGQFEGRPRLREGLMTTAQSLAAYFRSRGGRLSSSVEEEIALAPTVRMPDLPTIERVYRELKELEEAAGQAEPERVQETAGRLSALLEAARPLGRQSQPRELAEVSESLTAAAAALEARQFRQAAEALSRVLEVVRSGA